MKRLTPAGVFLMFCALPAFATVVVSSPSNGETVGSTANYVATATTSTCSRGIASMGIYLDATLVYVVDGDSLNKTLPIGPGKHTTVVHEWDQCGGSTYVSMEITGSSQNGIHVISPANNSTVSSPVNFVATATTACPKGVGAMGLYVNNQLEYSVSGASVNKQLSLGVGPQKTVFEAWDRCGGASHTPVDVTVQGEGNVLSNIQASSGWRSYGEFPPAYKICSAHCSGVTWSMLKNISSPSLSGNASQFNIGGSTPYSDVLWSNSVIGQFSTQGLPDIDKKLLPTLHNFTYDAYFYVTDLAVTQVLEFDISMYINGTGLIWGNQCNNLSGKVWDIWENQPAHWVSTGVPCNLLQNAWNHVTIQVQREPDNTLLYQSITFNGSTANLNRTYAPFSVPVSWWGITLNYQMDGDHRQDSNTTYLDKLNFTYW